MTSILIINSTQQLDYIKRNKRYLLDENKILSSSPLVCLFLNDEGYSPKNIDDFLSTEDYKRILNEALILSRQWFKGAGDLLSYKDINLGELFRIELLWFFRQVLASHIVVERVIQRYTPNQVIMFFDLSMPSIGRYRTENPNDVFQAVAAHLFMFNGIYIKKLYLKRIKSVLKKLISKNQGMANIINLVAGIKNLIKIRSNNNVVGMSWETFKRKTNRKLVIALGTGFHLLNLHMVLRELGKNSLFQGLLINFSTGFNFNQNRSGLKIDDSFGFLTLKDIDIPLKDKAVYKKELDEKRKIFRNIKRDLYHWLPEKLKIKYLQFQYDLILDCFFPEAVRVIQLMSYIFEQTRPDLVLVAEEKSFQCQALLKLAKTYGVKSVSVPHGIVGDIDEYASEADLFLAWGELSKEQLKRQCSTKDEGIAVVGAFHFDEISESLLTYDIRLQKEIKKKHKLFQDSPVVAILTCGFSQNVPNALNIKKYLNTWETIVDFARGHPDVEVVIKPHPGSDYIEWYQRLISRTNLPNFKLIENTLAEELLPAVDVCVLMGVISTVGLLSLLMKKPLVFCKSFLEFTTVTANDWTEKNGIRVIDDNHDLSPVLEKLLFDDQVRNECIKKGTYFLERNVRKGNTEGRMVEAIKSLVGFKGTRENNKTNGK